MKFQQLLEHGNLNEAKEIMLPAGNFVATKDFVITPGGGWNIKIKEGTVMFSVKGFGVSRWDSATETNIQIKPPISGVRFLKIQDYDNSAKMLAAWKDGTKKITKKVAQQANGR